MLTFIVLSVLLIGYTSESLLLTDDALSLSINAENEILFRDLNIMNLNWCLFYNRNEKSNHLYCASSPFFTQCHSTNDHHYTFSNVSLCDSNTELSTQLPIVGTFTDENICHMYKHLCCNLNTQQCIINNKIEIIENDVYIVPYLNGFLEFQPNTLSLSCISTKQNHPKCNQIPVIYTSNTDTNAMTLIDILITSSNSILILWTKPYSTSVFIHTCAISITDVKCAHLSEISVSDEMEQKINVIAYDECNLWLSVIVHKNDDIYTSYIVIYNYCMTQMHGKIDTTHITDDDDIYHTLNSYLTSYRISNLNEYLSETTCFIVNDASETIIKCLSFALQSSSSTISPPITSDTETHPEEWRNDIQNEGASASKNGSKAHSRSFWPYSDASFITVIVVSGVVIISCLICAVVCYSKYHQDKIRKEWYKAREVHKKKNKENKGKQNGRTLHIEADENQCDTSLYCNDSQHIYSASYPQQTCNNYNKNHFELEMNEVPPPPTEPPPIYHHCMRPHRKTMVSHRTLPTFEGHALDADIAPWTGYKHQQQFAFPQQYTHIMAASAPYATVHYFDDGETSVSSDTMEYINREKASYVLQSENAANEDGMDINEDEKQQYAAAAIPKYTAYSFRKQPKITRRCTEYKHRRRQRNGHKGYRTIKQRNEYQDDERDHNQRIKYGLFHSRKIKVCDSSDSDRNLNDIEL